MANYWYELNGEQHGAVDARKLRKLIRAGILAPFTLIWSQGFEQWAPVYSVAEFATWLEKHRIPMQGCASRRALAWVRLSESLARVCPSPRFIRTLRLAIALCGIVAVCLIVDSPWSRRIGLPFAGATPVVGLDSNTGAATRRQAMGPTRVHWINPASHNEVVLSDAWIPTPSEDLAPLASRFESSDGLVAAIIFEPGISMPLPAYLDLIRARHPMDRLLAVTATDPQDTTLDYQGPFVVRADENYEVRGRLIYGHGGIWRIGVGYPDGHARAAQIMLNRLCEDIQRSF